jgi:hypothetical protein
MKKRRCKACDEEFPATSKFFVTLTVRQKNGNVWRGFASECRPCRNKRYLPYYRKNRKRLIAKATKWTQRYRLTPEGAETTRKRDRERMRELHGFHPRLD